MKISIFGGGGFIGSAIVDYLLTEGHSIRIFERPRVVPFREFTAGEHVDWIAGDLSSAYDVSATVRGSDVVLHLVSTTLPKSSNDDPIYDVQTNVVSSLHILNAMASHGVRRIVFISSGGTVYGVPQFLPITELHPTNPAVSYGISKLAIEKYLQIYERLHNIVGISLRVSNPYGQRQRIETAQGAVTAFLHRAITGSAVEIWGDGGVVRDYIHVHDVARAFALAVKYSGSARVFNIGSGTGLSLNDLLEKIEFVLGKRVARRYLSARPFDVPANVLDCGLAHGELGWQPQISIEAGLLSASEWIKSQLGITSP